jgi:hypothetical protein
VTGSTRLSIAVILAVTVPLALVGTAHASDGTWERACGKDVVIGGGTDFELCTVAAGCKNGAGGGLGGEFAPLPD